MVTRRNAIRLLSSACAAAWLAPNALAEKPESAPALAPGAPTSPERLALITAFEKQSEGLQDRFEARTHKSTWVMPYRLFRPATRHKVPLVLYLHGSGGLGDDNLKQLNFGNRFGTRVWLLPENQQRFPCYVVAPQTDRGWIQYDFSQEPARELPGFGAGSRLALEIVDALCREFRIDQHRIYIAGNSMGGAGVWNVLANRTNFFAAAVITCGGVSPDDGTGSAATPLWAFHGGSDEVVPVSSARDRIAARRKAGGYPIYTEYPGADHNSTTKLGFTEPALPNWVFSQQTSLMLPNRKFASGNPYRRKLRLFAAAVSTCLLFADGAGVSRADNPQIQKSVLPLNSMDGLEFHTISEPGTDPLKADRGITDYRGRRAFRAVGQTAQDFLAIVRPSDFKDGTIEAEVAGVPRPGGDPTSRGFVGIAFHVQDHGSRYEAFYLRMTNGRAGDQLQRNHSAQYISHPDFPWKRLRDDHPGMYESYVDLEAGAWTRIKIVVSANNAQLYQAHNHPNVAGRIIGQAMPSSCLSSSQD